MLYHGLDSVNFAVVRCISLVLKVADSSGQVTQNSNKEYTK